MIKKVILPLIIFFIVFSAFYLKKTDPADEKVLFFIHTPKTGGSTIETRFQQEIPEHFSFIGWRDLLYPNKGAIKKNRCHKEIDEEFKVYSSHIFFGVHCDMEKFKYFTILRDPFDHIWSHFSYFVYSRGERKAVAKKEIPKTREEALVKLKKFMRGGYYTLDNEFIRRISGVGRTVPYGKITREHLELAKKNLKEHFIIIGIFEDYKKSLVLIESVLNTRYGLDIKMDYKYHARKNPHKAPLSLLTKEQKRRIIDMNKLDYELYEYGKKLHEIQFNNMPKYYLKKYEKIKSNNN